MGKVEQAMNVGDRITLRRVDSANEEVSVTVEGFRANAIQTYTDTLPPWLRTFFQSRGIFYGERASVRFLLFRDYKGNWTDSMTLLHFEIKEKI